MDCCHPTPSTRNLGFQVLVNSQHTVILGVSVSTKQPCCLAKLELQPKSELECCVDHRYSPGCLSCRSAPPKEMEGREEGREGRKEARHKVLDSNFLRGETFHPAGKLIKLLE